MNKTIKVLTGFLIVFLLYGGIAKAQDAETQIIKDAVIELFDGYRAGDSSRVSKMFTPDARIQTLNRNKLGDLVLSEAMPVSKLLAYIGGGFTEVHDERLWDTNIFYDKHMATVWTRYAFFLGKKFIHCGTETILLRKVKQDWKIFYIADTRQQENCNIPGSVK